MASVSHAMRNGNIKYSFALAVPRIPLCVALWCLSVCYLAGCGRSAAPNSGAATLDRGRALLAQRDYGQAATEFSRVLQQQPDNVETHYLLGVALANLHRNQEAFDELNRVVQANENYRDARVQLSHVMVRYPSQQYVTWAGDWAEKELAVKGPYMADAHAALAIRDFRRQHSDTARDHLAQALKLQPGNVRAAALLTLDQLVHGDLASARRTVTSLPSGAEVSEFQGEFYRLIGDTAAAAERFREAHRLAPGLSEAAANLADSLVAHDATSAEAESILQSLYAAHIQRFEHLHALHLMRLGRSAEGLKELEELYNRNPADALPRMRYFAALVETGQNDTAEKVLSKDLTVRPNGRTYALRATLRARTSRIAGARADILTGSSLDPDRPQLYYARALIGNVSGEFAQSQADLNEALRADSTFLPARLDLVRTILAQRTAGGATPDSAAMRSTLHLFDEIPPASSRIPSVVLLRSWLLLASGERELAERNFRESGLEGPDAVTLGRALTSANPGQTLEAARKGGSAVLTPFASRSLMTDLLEFPAGPVFLAFDFTLLDYLDAPKSAKWLVF